MNSLPLSAYPSSFRRSLRQAGRGDGNRLALLINDAFSDGENSDGVSECMREGHYFVLDGFEGELLGAVYVRPQGDIACISQLCVVESMRGLGLGRRLLAVAEAWSRTIGCSHTLISVNTAALAGLCARLGYSDSTRPLELIKDLSQPTPPLAH